MNPIWFALPTGLGAAAGLTAWSAMSPRAQLFGSTIRYTNSARKLALTFDDGPNPAITPQLLDLLDQHDAVATFFLIGNYVAKFPDLAREISERGHSIGNHTLTHPNLLWQGRAAIREELYRCSQTIADATGNLPRWFRPPFGRRNPWLAGIARELDLQVVMWSFTAKDWLDHPTGWFVNHLSPIGVRDKRYGLNATPGISRGEIICFHDGGHTSLNANRTRTILALKHWIPKWSELGLELVSMEEAV